MQEAPANPRLTVAGGRCAPVVVIRSVGVLAILASVWYLTWRTTNLTNGTVWLNVPLFACEFYAALRLWNLAFVAWTVGPLRALVGYFADPKLAMVQTPHEFYNRDSIQHAEDDHHEQSFFFHLIQPGRDAHGAAYWCGTGAVIRRTALVSVGGLSTATITEDFHTSLVLHGAGWKSRFHDEALTYGIAPQNLEQFILQRYRWSAGNLAALRTPHSPLRRNGLTLCQRLCYLPLHPRRIRNDTMRYRNSQDRRPCDAPHRPRLIRETAVPVLPYRRLPQSRGRSP